MDVPLFTVQTQHHLGCAFPIDKYSEGLLCMGGLVHNKIPCRFWQISTFTCLLLWNSFCSLILTSRSLYSQKPCDKINSFELKYYLFMYFSLLSVLLLGRIVCSA